MARARNIKPGFFSNDLLAEIAPLGRILFAGLWTLADREGRQEDRVKRIKAQLLPYDDCDCESLLQDLHEHGFIQRYTVAGAGYIQIVKWHEHQNPHMKEAESTIPAQDKNSASPVLDTTLTGTSRADSPIPHPLTDSPIPTTRAKPAAPADTEPAAFLEAWEAYPQRPGASRKDSLKAWRARIASGVAPEIIIAGVKRYAVYVKAKPTDPEFIKQPATFFGPSEHYLADWQVYAARAAPAQQNLAAAQKAANDEAKRRLFGVDEGRTIDA